MANIKNVLIAGGGLMGKNIAFVVSSNKEYEVTVYDIRPAEAVDVEGGIRTSTKALVDKGILSEEELAERLSRIHFTSEMDCEAVRNCDLVIEAVFENMDLKRETFAKLEAICRPDCIFCTNSSVMSPSEISRDLTHRERFVGTHFWNPGHLIPLVEVVKTDATSDETAQAVMEFMAGVGKKPALCNKDVPGFIANRMQHALWREAISIVENGIADAATVDMAVKNSFGLRLPQLAPLENSDLVGTDLTANIHNYVLNYIEDSHKTSPLINKMLEEGKMGFKSNEGFYKWTDESKAQVSADLNEYLVKMLFNK
ncbi:MAG: 3-hydroxyacyl-CoA dehydrogenase family protein [Clostridia bacterium]|nr:3-hydroxyacyl-CoA dehydrogenase family protein [Clostridia bacterium]